MLDIVYEYAVSSSVNIQHEKYFKILYKSNFSWEFPKILVNYLAEIAKTLNLM